MNTQTSGSNAVQRRNALLRAIGLASFLMILTGFGVSLYPAAKMSGLLGDQQNCLANRDSFLSLKQQRDTLISLLKNIENQYDQIMSADRNWGTAENKSEIKHSIETMEDECFDLAKRLKNLNGNILAKHSFNAYDDLLVARGMIWQERDKKTVVTNDKEGGGGTNQEVFMIRMEARQVANSLDNEARELENIVLKGIFWGRSRRKAQEKLENAITQLRSLANKLRNI